MSRRTILRSFIIVAVAAALTPTADAQDDTASYKVTLSADNVREFPKLHIKHRAIEIKGDNLVGLPIEIEPGITGIVLFGNGTFRFSPDRAKPIQGHFRAAMLRFHPKEQESFVPIKKANKTTDHAIHQMSQHLLNDVFRHCWHESTNAILPNVGTLSVVLYSKEHGDLMVADGREHSLAYNFTTKEQIYTRDQ